MTKAELKSKITLTKEEQKLIIENSISIGEAARKITGISTTLARTIIKELCADNNWVVTQFYNRKYYCLNCGKEIKTQDRSRRKFCSHSCAATYNNGKRTIDKKNECCLNCGVLLKNKNSKYCSLKCMNEFRYKKSIASWKEGIVDGGTIDGSPKSFVRRYMLEKSNYCCEQCGYNKINQYTGNSILQLHHKDGNCKNNIEENLEVLCPNCHALTDNFGSRNKNSTRIDRRTKYYRAEKTKHNYQNNQ